MKIKVDVEFGSKWYLKTDPYQEEYLLIGLILEPTDKPGETRSRFILSCAGTVVEVLPFECSQERDETKNIPTDDEE